MTNQAPTPAKADETTDLREALTRTQFIVAMAAEIGSYGRLPARAALPIASRAYQAFEADNNVSFGDQDFAWDFDAARIIAREYETAHWEAV